MIPGRARVRGAAFSVERVKCERQGGSWTCPPELFDNEHQYTPVAGIDSTTGSVLVRAKDGRLSLLRRPVRQQAKHRLATLRCSPRSGVESRRWLFQDAQSENLTYFFN